MGRTPEYDLVAMREAVKKCDESIHVFEEAIWKERQKKTEYERIVRTLEEKERQQPPKVTIDARSQEIFPKQKGE